MFLERSIDVNRLLLSPRYVKLTLLLSFIVTNLLLLSTNSVKFMFKLKSI
jgi:hypothetical protein